MVVFVVVFFDVNWNFLLDVDRNLYRVGFRNWDLNRVRLRHMNWVRDMYRDLDLYFDGIRHFLLYGVRYLLLDVNRIGLRDVYRVRLLDLDLNRDLDQVGYFLLYVNGVRLRHWDLDLLRDCDGLDMCLMLLFVMFWYAKVSEVSSASKVLEAASAFQVAEAADATNRQVVSLGKFQILTVTVCEIE